MRAGSRRRTNGGSEIPQRFGASNFAGNRDAACDEVEVDEGEAGSSPARLRRKQRRTAVGRTVNLYAGPAE